ncbi:hypothetical protein Tco_0206292 [Tanacetum coccineum]
MYCRIPKKRDDLKHKEEIKENKITPMEITMVAQFCAERIHELIAEEWDKQQCCRAAFRGLILKCRQSNGSYGQSSSFNKETSEGMRENEVDAVQGKTSQTDLSAGAFKLGATVSGQSFIENQSSDARLRNQDVYVQNLKALDLPDEVSDRGESSAKQTYVKLIRKNNEDKGESGVFTYASRSSSELMILIEIESKRRIPP